MNPTVRQLEAFSLAYRFGVLTRVGDEMCISQPAVSVLIRQLEENLGMRLFDRTSRSLRPTVAAEAIIPTVERMLRDMDSLKGSVQELLTRSRGQLNFASTPSIAVAIVPALVAEYKVLFPNIEVRVDDAGPERLTAATLAGDIEFGIGVGIGRGDDQPDGITLQCLAKDHLCVFCRKDSELGVLKRVRWEDILHLPWISAKSGTGLRMLIDETLFGLGSRKSPDYEVSYMATGLSMVQAGLGVAIFPGTLLATYPHPDIKAHKLVAPLVRRDIHLVTRSEHSLSPAAESFIELWHKRVGPV
ncbi:LysR family transcriptional regulator [Pandoraea pnomenusa]|uniref:LysR family transcriptional regulator n=1 Tax=Pandoraea pnomenusa TaxID=93220 RepID=UPI001ACCD4A8|nr:LysR family transcriptional regulator [Pandoraea pnomenusa]MBN9092385.1 LysR family transcriptional regulator [Pandoraea pnomenusa]